MRHPSSFWTKVRPKKEERKKTFKTNLKNKYKCLHEEFLAVFYPNEVDRRYILKLSKEKTTS